MGYNRCPLFTILTEQRLCVVRFVKINITIFSTLIFSKLGWPETPFYDSFVSKLKCNVWLGKTEIPFVDPL
jgi:hypothetical protein